MNELLNKIDAAIARLSSEFDNSPVTISIAITNLREKRALVVAGNYRVTQVNIPAIRAIGEMICENVKSREEWYSHESNQL